MVDIGRFGGGDDGANDIVVKLPVLRNIFFDVVSVELAAVACLSEVAGLDDDEDDGVGVDGRRTGVGVAVVLDTSRDVTERGVELAARRLLLDLLNSFVSVVVD